MHQERLRLRCIRQASLRSKLVCGVGPSWLTVHSIWMAGSVLARLDARFCLRNARLIIGGPVCPWCSPFVCNCDHGWAEHKQVELAEAPSSSISGMLAAAAAAELDAMQTVQRGGSNANG